MSNNAFDGQILLEKLSKLNNSAQSIESLSRWCVSHRKKAKQVVEKWDKLFNSAQKEQCVSFLYLANDILQNSRRKGNEFVNEFWKVLPSSLKHAYGTGDENLKKAVMRLVDIWEDRKVFGSRGQSLKNDLLGKDPPPVVSNGKSLNSIKILKKDSQSVRIRLVIGGLPEKIITAFQPVYDEDLNEEATLNKCNAAVHHVGTIEEDLKHNSSTGNQQGSATVNDLQEQENVLEQCVGTLANAEASRDALVSLLKEALQDQESKLELVRVQLQVARGQIEQVNNIRKRLVSHSFPAPLTTTTNPATDVSRGRVLDQNLPPAQPNSTAPLIQPVVSFAPLKTNDEESKKAAAAAVVAKLAASTSSAQMLTSVLSSLVAEEAASMNGGVGFTTSVFSPEKRAKLDQPIAVSDAPDMSSSAYYNSIQQQQMTSAAQFAPPQTNQFGQSGGMMMPYGYTTNTLPPPPLRPHVAMGLTRPTQPQQQQLPASGGYYPPPPGFYGQNHQPTPPPPVPPRQ